MKNNFKRIAATIAVLVITLLLTGCGSKSTKDGYTAKAGEALNLKGPITDISVKVVSGLDKHDIKGVFDTETYGRLQIELENKNKAELDMTTSTYVSFGLADANKNDIALATSFETDDTTIYGKTIASGTKETGYQWRRRSQQ